MSPSGSANSDMNVPCSPAPSGAVHSGFSCLFKSHGRFAASCLPTCGGAPFSRYLMQKKFIRDVPEDFSLLTLWLGRVLVLGFGRLERSFVRFWVPRDSSVGFVCPLLQTIRRFYSLPPPRAFCVPMGWCVVLVLVLCHLSLLFGDGVQFGALFFFFSRLFLRRFSSYRFIEGVFLVSATVQRS